MAKKLTLNELEKLINRIPSSDSNNDINYLISYLSKAGESKFQSAFEKFQKVNFANSDQKLLDEAISTFICNAQNSEQSFEIFNFFNGKIDQILLFKHFTTSEYMESAILQTLKSQFYDNEDNFRKFCYNLMSAFTILEEVPKYIRSLRQSVFQLAFDRKEFDLCLDIIKSINLARSSDDFTEFSACSTTLTKTAVDNEPIARSLFEYMINCSTFYYNGQEIEKEKWFISCLTSFSPLLYGKTVHSAVLEYFRYFPILINNLDHNFLSANNINIKQLKQIISKFEDASRPIYNDSLPLNSSPSLVRPYYLFKQWEINVFAIDPKSGKNFQPELIYNTFLNLCKRCPDIRSSSVKSRSYIAQLLFQLLDQLPLETSLPFYFLLAQRGYENEFNDVVTSAFNDLKNSKNHDKIIQKILQILEIFARTDPSLLKSHFDSLSKLKIDQCTKICSYLIKSEFLSFTSLWKFVKNLPFDLAKPIVREGIIQIQRRSKSFENAKFIVHVLYHFFGDSSSKDPAINWSAVAEAFPDDINISSTIFLNESIISKNKNVQNDIDSNLLSWKEQFMNYISKSPSIIHRIVAAPYLLLCSLDTEVQPEKVKWAVSKLPAYQNIPESVIEGYSIFEISRHIISESDSLELAVKSLHELFGYEKEKITSYASSFAHAAIALNIGSIESLNALKQSIESDHLLISRSSKLAINFLKLNKFIFGNKYNDVVQKSKDPLVDTILELLSPTGISNSKLINATKDEANLKNDEKDFIQMMIKAHSIDYESFAKLMQITQFNDLNELRKHLAFLSISCYLLLSSRSISPLSTEKCLSLLNSPSSSYQQKSFALLALSQSSSFPDSISLEELAKDSNLHRSILIVAVRNKNSELVSSILSKSNDFTILEAIKPLLPFLDHKIIFDFVHKTAPQTDVQILFNYLDFFTDPQIFSIIFSNIRNRPIIDTIRKHRYEKLQYALTKISNKEELEKIVFAPFDDFALLSMIVLDIPASKICQSLINDSSKVTLQAVFTILLNKRDQMFQFAEAMFTIISSSDADTVEKVLKFIAIFFLIGSTKDPFDTIRFHLEQDLSNLTEDLLNSLIPSLFSKFINRVNYYEILMKANKAKNNEFLSEAVHALRLKTLS